MITQPVKSRGSAQRPMPAGRSRHGDWVVTLLAMAASTYALDAFATTGGGALAASGLLTAYDRPLLVVCLIATYVLWAAGLRANLAANWALLTTKGMSTNVLSKAAHDIAHRRHAGPRARRFAASSGYLLTEAAKEVPYYTGAFGTAALSNTITAAHAIVFLAGTNIGAGIYEYGAARATRALLRSGRPSMPAKAEPERSCGRCS
jgi:hypothetical protein